MTSLSAYANANRDRQRQAQSSRIKPSISSLVPASLYLKTASATVPCAHVFSSSNLISLQYPLLHFMTLSNDSPRTDPPAIAVLTFRLNPSRLDLRSSAAVLLSGSLALGSKNKNCNPTITAFKFSTGFQSSRRMFRHTLPSRSMFGW